MARVLIIGCGCRGLALAGELLAAGHAVRGTTRDPARAAAIAQAGAEPYVGDPDRVAALHDGRLRMLWEKLVDTPVRGVVHEAAGPLDLAVLARGRAVALAAHETWRIPLELLEADPGDHERWRATASGAVGRLLGG